MLRKHIITTLLFLLCALAGAQAQQLKVSSFKGLPTDLDARVNYPVIDQNGKKCAIIKVENSNTGFTFDTGTLSVQKVEQKVAEIWVYVQPGVRKITIKHQTLGILREYIFPEQIKEATVYAMTLESGSVHTSVEQALSGAYLTMRLTPANAIVWIDDELKTSDDGVVMIFLKNGFHTYRVRAAGYEQEIGKVEINGERKDMQVVLKSSMASSELSKATLKLSCADPQTALFVDGKQVGKGQWLGEIIPGIHLLEAKRDGHRSQTKQIVLKESETFEHSFASLVAINGFLQIESRPVDSEVWLDSKKAGTTPYGPAKTLAGVHQLELRKAGYITLKREVVVNEGEITMVNNALEQLKKIKNTPAATVALNSSVYRSKGFEYSLGLSAMHSSFRHSCNIGSGEFADGACSLLTSYGYRFSPHFYLGAGGGLLYDMQVGNCYMPIYIDSRIDFLKKKVTPFINLKYGYTPVDFAGKGDPGIFYSIAVGYSFGVWDIAFQYMNQHSSGTCDKYRNVTNECVGSDEMKKMFGLTLSYNF